MIRLGYFLIFSLGLLAQVSGQGITRRTFHDKEGRNIKEIYVVTDTLTNILNGKYVSYYLNGQVESKGQFVDNETSGVWEFYYETGKLKMRGILQHSNNVGHWEYFYENGQKSMEGNIDKMKRQGIWKSYYENGQLKEEGEYTNNKRTGYWRFYFEDGVLKGDINYEDDFGRYTEYDHDGRVVCEGPRRGSRQVGHWRYFNENAALQSEGDFEDGKKTGEWTYYHDNGEIAARGNYLNDEQSGTWTQFLTDGTVVSTGDYTEGKKEGYWQTMFNNGSKKSEITYSNGVGQYKEYYPSGRLMVQGNVVNEEREGLWVFFTPEGKQEGECEYTNGRGTYKGYYPNGSLRTRGEMDDDRKVGTWEIYEQDGTLSGYYRPFYDDKKLAKEIAELAGKSNRNKVETSGRHFNYYDPRFNEFRGLIIGTNPVFTIVGQIPVAVEFYMERRLGTEFEFIGIRHPFFKSDQMIPIGKKYQRGYSMCIRQKYYNSLKAGLWYFGHELRFTNLGHFSNVEIPQVPGAYFTVSSVEQRIEYGLLTGYRIMKHPTKGGFTLDAFVSYDIGYKGFDIDESNEVYFKDIDNSGFSQSFHFGLNFGNVFSYR